VWRYSNAIAAEVTRKLHIGLRTDNKAYDIYIYNAENFLFIYEENTQDITYAIQQMLTFIDLLR